jgi:predicted O-methyltransferase YrrM
MDGEADMSFEEKWNYINKRRQNVVQQKSEMAYIHDLIAEYKPESYLEIGTAEGDSLYVFGSLLPEHGRIHWIDKAEPHTTNLRIEAEELLKPRNITSYAGLSTDVDARVSVQRKMFDVVYIDGGHDYETVCADTSHYLSHARKVVIWHDIQMPEVKRAIRDTLSQKQWASFETFIDSDTMGYAILRVG